MWVGRKLLALAGAWTVEPIYRQSHEYHIALRNWQCRWIEMTDGIEYKLHTRSSFDEGGTTAQSVWIRNAGITLVDEIHFCVEAKLGRLSYQVPLTVYRLRPGCMAKLAVQGLPLQDLAIQENKIFATYESLHIYPVRIVRNHRVEFYSTDGTAWHPTHDDILNGKWKRWNGRLYNTKAISEARREVLLRLAHAYCGRYGFFDIDASRLFSQALRTGRYRRVPGLLIYALASSGPMLSIIIWARLLLRIERISFECDASMLAAQEYVMHKGEGARPIRTVSLDDASRTTTDRP
jgi:hypothetical protein